MALTSLTKPRARWATFKLKAAQAVSRSLYDKLLDRGVSIKDFGAKCDGVTDDTAAVQAAINMLQDVHFPKGDCLISSVQIHSKNKLTFDKASRVIPSTDNVSLFYTQNVSNTYADITIDGLNVLNVNSVSGVTVLDLPYLRHNCQLMNIKISGADKSYGWIGMNLPKLNWNSRNRNIEISHCASGFRLREAAAVLTFIECTTRYNSIAWDIVEEASDVDRVTQIRLLGGICQQNDTGVHVVRSTTTLIDGVHFELNTTDIDADGTDNLRISYCEFRGNNDGLTSTGIRLRNTTETIISYPAFAGIRQLGFLDVDTSNARCVMDVLVSADAPTRNIFWTNGDQSGISVSVQRGYFRSISGTSVNPKIPTEYISKIVPEGGVAMTSVTSDEGDRMAIVFRTSSGYTSGAISFEGVNIGLDGIAPNKNKAVEFQYRASLGGWFILKETLWN